MSLHSTLLADDTDSKDMQIICDEAKEESNSPSRSRKMSLSSSSSSSVKKTMDYTSPLCFYSQVGLIDTNSNEMTESQESAIQIILPHKNICLGYSIGYKVDDSMDIVDGSVWLYRPRNIPSNIYYLCLLLTLIFVIDIVLILLIVFSDDYSIHFNQKYNGGHSGFVIAYYTV